MGDITIERHGRGVVRLLMAQKATRNALGEDLRGQLIQALEPLLTQGGARVVILASGLKDFSVGGDLKKMDDLPDVKAGRQRIRAAHPLAQMLLATDIPLIAEITGHAVGAGAGLALICDTIVMAETASIGFPFARVGLAPDFAIGHTLPQRMGLARARQALLYARSYRGVEALDVGIADDVVAVDKLTPTVMERAEELAALPSLALGLTKRMLAHAEGPAAVLDFEAAAQPLCFASPDFAEGLAAFREKRKPKFDPDIN
jgi:2-(1,2-epoxy-1,2-dihydrophenyl)acetyl-CoA isomerase